MSLSNISKVIALVVCWWCMPACAEDGHFYAGGVMGLANLDDDDMGAHQDFEDNSGLISLQGGYQFSRYAAVQLNLDLLGAYEGETRTADTYTSYSALTVSLVPRLPLSDRLSLYGEIGAGFISVYQWVDGTIGTVYYDDDDEINSGTATVFAAGISYVVDEDKALELRFGYRQTDFETDALAISNASRLFEDEYEQTIKQFYAGAVYHIR